MDPEQLHELFAPIGPIRIRRLFGGQGIYADGLIVAIVVGGELMLKVDSTTADEFAEAGSRRWQYARSGRTPVDMPYFTLPEDAFEDSDSAAHWLGLALGAAHRVKAAQPVSPRRKARKKG